MLSEKLRKKLHTISEEFEKRGFSIEEDLVELAETREDIAERIENTKFKKISFFQDEELNSVGFTLEDVQVEFIVTLGEDEQGPWYEATAEIRFF
ncbi:hypothetical protein IX317_000051 [Fusobacterium sp. DD29]|uniref:hypothetical protein n=1 Tax=unclassified Fusobacterium TaxID=2648384 RepID=UPI001B8C38A3|nr:MULTISPECIES: hypothetical protein [unclassified Fusobacterium]MBR8700401.1 hypothetical protein [Fusobacterium sp. DD45]MBR8710094.1 hypothetical protein [Fusobacterium sp. DD28]MBR8748394.1 hypothetical protein [Fusobacterium sp. DD29]MBR8750672.1 hypothetical protein [Fusobacterium sp. DD26]MBR8760632.1 hypothetical protein [Fusobacterium sp. DD25]